LTLKKFQKGFKKIEEIKNIIAEVGGFYVGEIEAQGICVNEMGNFVAIAEGFFKG